MKAMMFRMIAAAACLVAGAAAAQAQVGGVWRNERGTVDVRIGPCGRSLCGTIVRASPQAVADARAAGVDRLIGTHLMENYTASGPGEWAGTVFVPDMGRRFSSTLEQVDGNHLRIYGCLFNNMMCRSETWTRVAPARR